MTEELIEGRAAVILRALEKEGQQWALLQAATRISTFADRYDRAAVAVDTLYKELVLLQNGETAAVQSLLSPLCQVLEIWPFNPPEPPAGPVGAETVN